MAEVGGSKTGLSPVRENAMLDAANQLADARRTSTPILDLPGDLKPTSTEEAYAVQMLLAEAYGEIGGWKVGAPSADATPMFAPMPTVWIAPSGTTFRALRYRGLEAEVAFRMGRDLPPRTDAYTRDEVLAAVSSCHPAIEILESGLTDPGQADRLSMIADLQMHGGFVYGPAYADWRSVDFSAERVVLSVEGMVRVERTGSNTAGDLLRLLPWLANEGAARTGGLRAGQWITTGSWTGNLQAGERSTVDVTFSTLGRVETRFEPEQELEKGLPGAAVRSFP